MDGTANVTLQPFGEASPAWRRAVSTPDGLRCSLAAVAGAIAGAASDGAILAFLIGAPVAWLVLLIGLIGTAYHRGEPIRSETALRGLWLTFFAYGATGAALGLRALILGQHDPMAMLFFTLGHAVILGSTAHNRQRHLRTVRRAAA